MPGNEGMRGTRILLVEDDPLLKDSLSIFLRTKGCRILAFPDADAALEALGSEGFDVVISDHRLPGMDGLSFLRRVESAVPDAIRILITAYPGSGLSAEAGRSGAHEFVSKPFTGEDLEKTLVRLLETQRSGRNPFKLSVES